MKVTRRKFLKFLAVGVLAPAIPAAALEAAAENTPAAGYGVSYEWVSFDEMAAMYPPHDSEIFQALKPIKAETAKMFDISPLLSGELGEYSGVTFIRDEA